jgi:RNA polymerase sigma-54 factor
MAMQLSQSASMRMEQRQLLTPRMIQSMEILQLPLAALEERIDQELQANPVLELRTRDPDAPRPASEVVPSGHEPNRPLDLDEAATASQFRRLERMGDYLDNEEFATNAGPYRGRGDDDDRDAKLDALAAAPDRETSLADHLLAQWSLLDVEPRLRPVGELIIRYLDADGYLRTSFEQIRYEAKQPVSDDDLRDALALVQTLEPAGVGARNLTECLLLQLDAIEKDEELAEGHDFELERALLRDHARDLELNRYPQISQKLGRPIEELKAAVRRLSRLHPHPGRQIGPTQAPPITPDAVIYYDEDTGRYEIKMTRDPAPSLMIRKRYEKMARDRAVERKTREFLNNNIRNARWLVEAIEQRRNTIQRVLRVVVDAQRDFFDLGPEHLKPLPMIQVADRLGIHVATVSRAVSEKWIQTPRGLFPLRRFFSGGTTSADGEEMSWDAVKEKLKSIIDTEDKRKPLNDDEIVKKLQEQGIKLARRTVAKYRDLLNIPTARQRRQF